MTALDPDAFAAGPWLAGEDQFAAPALTNEEVAASEAGRVGTVAAEDPRPPLPAEFWQHPRLAHVRQAAHARGRAPAGVLVCVLVRLCAELEHVYVLPPIVGADGSLNLAVAPVGASGSGKSTSDHLAAELLDFVGCVTPRPRGLSLGSGEGVAEAYMGSRPATEDEKDAGLAVQGKIREQVRWNELFVGDEGQAVLAHGKRSGSTLLPTLRTLVTGGTLGQQNAAGDNRRMIPAHRYRAGVLLGFQTATAVELLDDAGGGTPQRFVFVAATDSTIPAPGDRPSWPGELAVDLPPPSWRDSLPKGPYGLRRIPVCDAARREILDDDHARNTGADGDVHGAHRNLVRAKVAAHLGVLLDGRPAVTDETWRLAGMLVAHSRAVIADIEAHSQREARQRERATSDRLAERAVNAAVQSEAHRIVECAKKIARKVRTEPGISRSDARRSLVRWRDVFDDGLDHAINTEWVTEHREPGQGEAKRVLHPGNTRP